MNLERIITIAMAAQRRGSTGPLSTGEVLTAALVLNRHDWLADLDYSIAQALDRIASDSIKHLREAERWIACQPGEGSGP